MAKVDYQTTGEQESDYSPVPAGDYIAHIKDSALKEPKGGGKDYLALTWEILAPEQFRGRLIFENLNLRHENTTAREIAQKSMNSICLALGKTRVDDSAELHNKAMSIKVAVKTDVQYGDSNVIKKHSAIAGQQQAPSQAAPSTGNQPAKNPWEK